MQNLYRANRTVIDGRLQGLEHDWRILEIGGGNGRLWERALPAASRGAFVLIDPVSHVHDLVASHLPEKVVLESRIALAQDALNLPETDIALCSLTLHHVAGKDRLERLRHGLTGPGKLEVLTAIGDALRRRNGIGILNEADIFCDLGLAPGSEALVNNLMDSYVRRTARALLDEIAMREDADLDLKRRWLTIIRLWCMDQLAMADKPIADRDVYELDVARWLSLLDEAGLRVISHGFTDPYYLFHQYVFCAR